MILAKAIRLLLSNRISEESLQLAQKLLTKFCKLNTMVSDYNLVILSPFCFRTVELMCIFYCTFLEVLWASMDTFSFSVRRPDGSFFEKFSCYTRNIKTGMNVAWPPQKKLVLKLLVLIESHTGWFPNGTWSVCTLYIHYAWSWYIYIYHILVLAIWPSDTSLYTVWWEINIGLGVSVIIVVVNVSCSSHIYGVHMYIKYYVDCWNSPT